MGKVIIISEGSYRKLFENTDDNAYDLQRRIAIWCLRNDFLIYNPRVLFGRKVITVNDSETQRDVVAHIMQGGLEEDNSKAFMFGDEESVLSEYTLFRVPYDGGSIYLEIPKDALEYDQPLDDDADDDENIAWFKEQFD